jgi:hypothetical protein
MSQLCCLPVCIRRRATLCVRRLRCCCCCGPRLSWSGRRVTWRTRRFSSMRRQLLDGRTFFYFSCYQVLSEHVQLVGPQLHRSHFFWRVPVRLTDTHFYNRFFVYIHTPSYSYAGIVSTTSQFLNTKSLVDFARLGDARCPLPTLYNQFWLTFLCSFIETFYDKLSSIQALRDSYFIVASINVIVRPQSTFFFTVLLVTTNKWFHSFPSCRLSPFALCSSSSATSS